MRKTNLPWKTMRYVLLAHIMSGLCGVCFTWVDPRLFFPLKRYLGEKGPSNTHLQTVWEIDLYILCKHPVKPD